MKNILLTLLAAVGLVGTSTAATLVNYVASADPNTSPDAVGGTDVWQCSFPTGNAGSGFFAPGTGTPGAGGPNDWVIYSYGDPSQGAAYQTYNFQGNGVLNVGQTVSLTYGHNTNITTGNKIGIQLLSAGAVVQAEFVFIGGGANGFAYGDTGIGFASEPATGKGYDANDPFKVTFTLTSSTRYSGTAGATATNTSAGAWSGTYSAPITGIRVVNINAGNGSDQYSNNLVVANVPEPTTLAMLAGGGLLGGLLIRRRRSS